MTSLQEYQVLRLVPREALLIGGAVMLELGLKDATKDIDVVCRSEEDIFIMKLIANRPGDARYRRRPRRHKRHLSYSYIGSADSE